MKARPRAAARVVAMCVASMGVAGCGSRPHPTPVAPPAPTVQAAPPTPPVDGLEPIELGPLASPSWLAPRTTGDETGMENARVVAIGRASSLVRVEAGLFGNTRDGVVGPLAVPADAIGVGLDGDDRVYFAASDGSFSVAPSVKAAQRAAGFERRGKVDDARSFDVFASKVVVATGGDVFVSTNAARSFRRTRPPSAGATVRQVFALAGGIAAHLDDGDTAAFFLSRDDGKSWTRSTYSPTTVERWGGDLVSDLPCPAVLDESASSWQAAPALPKVAPTAGWSFELRSLAAPETGTPPGGGPDYHPARAFQSEFAVDPRGGCYKRKPPQQRTPPSDAPLTVGCGPGLCIAGLVEPEDWRSDVGLALLQPLRSDFSASLVLFDRSKRSARALPLPAGCRPHRVEEGAGLSVLTCEGNPTPVYLFGREGTDHAETPLPVASFEITSITFAQDGTILVRTAWHDRGRRRAFVRAPLELGDSAAWREVGVADALELRVAPSGAVLSFHMSPRPLTVVWNVAVHRPGKAREPLVRTTVTTDVRNAAVVDVSVDENQHIVVWRTRRMTMPVPVGSLADRRSAVPVLLTRGGSLRRPIAPGVVVVVDDPL